MSKKHRAARLKWAKKHIPHIAVVLKPMANYQNMSHCPAPPNPITRINERGDERGGQKLSEEDFRICIEHALPMQASHTISRRTY